MALITSENRGAWQGLADDCAKTRPSKGKRVRVTSGKHKGKEGIVTWHGRDQFADTRYQTDAQLMLRDFMGTWGFRCRISTASESFFVKAEKVEIIPDEIIDEPDRAISYTCPQCGKPITAADADDNGGKCGSCEAGGEYPIDND